MSCAIKVQSLLAEGKGIEVGRLHGAFYNHRSSNFPTQIMVWSQKVGSIAYIDREKTRTPQPAREVNGVDQ